MLVLSRKVGETIVINNDVVVKVDRIERGKVYLAFSAPEAVRIVRGELTKGDAPRKEGEDAGRR